VDAGPINSRGVIGKGYIRTRNCSNKEKVVTKYEPLIVAAFSYV
jgi:hypothetical protein